MSDTILEVKHLKKYFNTPKGTLHAVDDVSFTLERGKTLGIVGESGCGKSPTGRAILRLIEPTAGEVIFNGEDITKKNKEQMRLLRREMQLIFQDPYASLNPRMTIGEIIAEPLNIQKRYKTQEETRAQVLKVMEVVGLNTKYYNRYPHEFSGGQRQRIGIARALAVEPSLIIADEPVSALDVSIQAQVLNLLNELKHDLDLTYIFVAHDLSVVEYISDRVGVMYLGNFVEVGEKEKIYSNPMHPYTQALLSAVPVPDPKLSRTRKRIILEGDVPSPMNPPSGCRFHTRCPYATEKCSQVAPVFREHEPGHWAACHLLDK